jgi:hypothetical protein
VRSYLVTGFGILEVMRPSLAILVLTIACGAYLLLWLIQGTHGGDGFAKRRVKRG